MTSCLQPSRQQDFPVELEKLPHPSEHCLHQGAHDAALGPGLEEDLSGVGGVLRPEIPAEAAVVLDGLAFAVPRVDDDAQHAEAQGLLGPGIFRILKKILLGENVGG